MKENLWPILLLLIADSLILADVNPNGRYVAAALILAFLSGWAWLPVFCHARSLDLTERFILAIGLSLALTIISTMYVVYLPGLLTAQRLLIANNGLIILGLITGLFFEQPSTTPTFQFSRHVYFALILVLLIAAALRLPRLGYAEFHEDEAEALMLGVRVLQGENYAIFLHRKGPAQMLLPLAFWLLTNRITETMARLPFALCSILSVATLFLMGRRWFGGRVGLAAALLWAINGYAIAFGRMVQYQAIIFFLGPLAIYSLYLAYKIDSAGLKNLSSFLLATCLLAHFDSLLWLPVAIWLSLPRKLTILSLLPYIILLILLASFYIPYFRDPEFANTAAYLAQSRVKPGLLYNNLNLLWQLDQTYSSRVYLPILACGISALIFKLFKLKRDLLGLGFMLCFVAIASTIWQPAWWRIGTLNLAILPCLIMGGFCFWSAQQLELRIAWVMFGAPFIGYVFLVDDPRTHLYIIYPAAVVLAAVGICLAFKPNMVLKPVRFGEIILGLFLVLLAIPIIAYENLIFLQTESTLQNLQNPQSKIPKERSYFGYPKRVGWKGIGALRAQGLFPGDFRSVNEDFIVAIWYNYGQARSCYDTPTQFFVHATAPELRIPRPYQETARLQREGEVRLFILSDKPTGQARSLSYDLENLEASFDELATPNHFIQQAQPAQPVGTQFGTSIRLVGYDLLTSTVTTGETLYLNLYWQATAQPSSDYRAFVHLTNGATLLAQQDDNPICRLPTSVWRAGQHGLGQFRLTIKPNTPPGRYPLVVGLYQANTLQRLTITSGLGQAGDDFLWLQDITIDFATQSYGD